MILVGKQYILQSTKYMYVIRCEGGVYRLHDHVLHHDNKKKICCCINNECTTEKCLSTSTMHIYTSSTCTVLKQCQLNSWMATEV